VLRATGPNPTAINHLTELRARLWDGQAVFRLERLDFNMRPYGVEAWVKDEQLEDWVGLREGARGKDNEWGYEARYPADFQDAPKTLAMGRLEVVWRQTKVSAAGPTSNCVELARWAGSYREGRLEPN
jgi:hypothetical protein